jgi:uncharacterized membrane protein
MDGFKIFANVLAGLLVVLGFMAIILVFIFYWFVLRPEVQRRDAEEKERKKYAETVCSITIDDTSDDN